MAGNMQDNFDENGNPIRCSFCGKEQGQVRRLVKGPTSIYICDECVAACSEILEESLASDFMDAARNGSLPGFLNDHGQAASQPAADPETEGFELEDDRQVITRVPTPHEIYDELSAYVMGQEDAKRAMSVAVYNHYRRVIEGGAAVSALDEADGMGGQFDDDMDEVELLYLYDPAVADARTHPKKTKSHCRRHRAYRGWLRGRGRGEYPAQAHQRRRWRY